MEFRNPKALLYDPEHSEGNTSALRLLNFIDTDKTVSSETGLLFVT